MTSGRSGRRADRNDHRRHDNTLDAKCRCHASRRDSPALTKSRLARFVAAYLEMTVSMVIGMGSSE